MFIQEGDGDEDANPLVDLVTAKDKSKDLVKRKQENLSHQMHLSTHDNGGDNQTKLMLANESRQTGALGTLPSIPLVDLQDESKEETEN